MRFETFDELRQFEREERGVMKKRIKNSFLTPLVVEVMPSGKRFRLHYDFTYQLQRLGVGKGFTVAVPAGFLTDFASIPRIFRIIIPKLGRWNKAAVVHDFLYQNPESGRRFEVGYVKWTRKGADVVFLDAMKDLGVPKWKRNLMYWAVRIGGFMAWRKR